MYRTIDISSKLLRSINNLASNSIINPSEPDPSNLLLGSTWDGQIRRWKVRIRPKIRSLRSLFCSSCSLSPTWNQNYRSFSLFILPSRVSTAPRFWSLQLEFHDQFLKTYDLYLFDWIIGFAWWLEFCISCFLRGLIPCCIDFSFFGQFLEPRYNLK